MSIREIPELKADIIKLKKESGTAVVSHYYQEPDVAELSDCVGDCAELAAAVRKMEQKRVVVCGVHFVAEAVKLLCPEKEIILAHPQARCPVSGQIYPGRLRSYREEHPGALIVGCATCSDALKAESDFCVTPGNAIELIRRCEQRDILFYSDRNLGSYIAAQLPNKSIELMSCCCPMLSSPEPRDVELARIKWPEAVLAVNNGCRRELAELADMVGSTRDIIRYCEAVEWDVIIADEESVCAGLSRRFPKRRFCQLAPSKMICNNMRITTLEILERTLKGEFGLSARPDPQHEAGARRALEVMLEPLLSSNV